MSSKRAIVTFANERGNYIKGVERLESSLIMDSDFDFIKFIGEQTIGCPPHLENPYAFKIYAIDKAREMGYTQILWLDSSVAAIKSTKPIWDIIEQDGYIMQDAGHYVGRWCNDYTLNYFGITRDEAMTMPMYGNAGLLGLDFKKTIPYQFFYQWKESMLAGCFKGAWTNNAKTESQDERCAGHRHDMVCGSIIADRMNMKYQNGENILEYADLSAPPKNETIIFKAQGM